MNELLALCSKLPDTGEQYPLDEFYAQLVGLCSSRPENAVKWFKGRGLDKPLLEGLSKLLA